MRDVKHAFDNRRAMPPPPGGAADFKPELEPIKLLAQHALQTALAAAESAKSEAAALRAEMETLRVEAAQRQHEFEAICMRVQHVETLAGRPSVKHLSVQRGADGEMTGATVTEVSQ